MKDINAAAKALGRLGGLKGGKARAAKLTAEQRSEIAKKAAAKRWAVKKQNELAETASLTDGSDDSQEAAQQS